MNNLYPFDDATLLIVTNLSTDVAPPTDDPFVRADDDLYVRSAYGADNPWYRRAKVSGIGRIRTGGLERDVTFAEADFGVHPEIDAAYHAKYDRYGPRTVGSFVGSEVKDVTIKLVPRATE